MADVDVVIPGAFQALFRPKRFKIFYGGRGGAKSWNFAHALVLEGARRPIRVLCTREYQKSIKESVHKLLGDAIERCGLGQAYEILDAKIRGRNGTEFFFEGLRNDPKGIKSIEGITHVWCEEAEAISEESWKFLIPTIRTEGSEIWLSFNPGFEEDPTAQRFLMPYINDLEKYGVYEDDRYYIRRVGWQDNPFFPQVLRDEMEADYVRDPTLAAHVWGGDFRVAVQGAILGEELKQARQAGRITRVPIVTRMPVTTFWDLGRSDTTAIVFMQFVNAEARVVDFYESRFNPLDHYARVLREKGYIYEAHYLPHDVEVEEIGSGLTRRSQLETMGVRPITVVPRVKKIEDGIAALRGRFSELWIDEDRCEDLVKALKAYSFEYDERTGTYKDKPGPKWATNPVDALRQWAQGHEAFDPFAGADDWTLPNRA